MLSSLRSNPVYGKLDFIKLDSRPWWPEWKPIIEQVFEERKTVYTDPVTALVLHVVFNIDTIHGGRRHVSLGDGSMHIELMIRENSNNKYHCLINLKGFKKSWVAIETGHWQHTLSDTARHYELKGVSGEILKENILLKNIRKCNIYK